MIRTIGCQQPSTAVASTHYISTHSSLGPDLFSMKRRLRWKGIAGRRLGHRQLREKQNDTVPWLETRLSHRHLEAAREIPPVRLNLRHATGLPAVSSRGTCFGMSLEVLLRFSCTQVHSARWTGASACSCCRQPAIPASTYGSGTTSTGSSRP